MNVFYRRLFLYVVPAILIFLGYDKLGLVKFENEETNTLVKLSLFCSGFFVINLIVPILNEKDKKRISDLTDSLEKASGNIRKIVSGELGALFKEKGNPIVNITDLQLNIRIYVPEKRNLYDRIFNCKSLYFQYVNYDSLHVKDIGDDLRFQVLPKEKAQGLIGKVYDCKSIKYDFQLNENIEKKGYNLTESQKDITGYSKFAIVTPIFKKRTDKIIAIVTLDSEIEVIQPAGQKWRDVIITHCKIIHKNHTLLNSK